jgi:orotate phosphoribosyltransferase
MNENQADFRIKPGIPEGNGQTAVIIDDVITTAGTKLKAAKILRAHGFEVHDILVCVNRASDLSLLTEESLQVNSIFEMMPLMDFYLEKSIKVNQHRYDAVKKYLQS